jgi:hypothetical protein
MAEKPARRIRAVEASEPGSAGGTMATAGIKALPSMMSFPHLIVQWTPISLSSFMVLTRSMNVRPESVRIISASSIASP